jgi:3-hydroxyisobutyrate dehydrogenase
MVWNRTPSRAEPLREKGALVASSIGEVAAHCNPIFICVSKTEDVEAVIGQIEPHALGGSLVVDHSTIEPAAASRLGERLRGSGLRFMDAPLTGGEKGALAATLTIFCGGEASDFEEAEPLMGAYAQAARLVGPLGAGQMMKMANQISVALCVLAMSECLVFAERAGLDLEDAIELIGSGAGGSWSLANYGPKVLERDWAPGFAVSLQQKDLVYALKTARDLGVSLPGTALTHQLFAALENSGRGGQATPALFEVIESLAGAKK